MSAVAALLLSLMGTDRLGDPIAPGVVVRYGTNRLCVGPGEGTLRFHPTRDEVTFVPKGKSPAVVARAPRNWRTDTFDEDVDPFPLTKTSTDGRRIFTLRFRIDDKADRYRGYPECFVQVFDTRTNRVEARYAFRLDDTDAGRLKQQQLRPNAREEPPFGRFLLSDDGDFLAWVDHTCKIRIRHLPIGRVVTARSSNFLDPRIAFSPNGRRFALLDSEGVIRLIDSHTGRLLPTDQPPTAALLVAISPDGRRIATGHAFGEIWVWDGATGKPLWHTDPTERRVWRLRFSPDGSSLAAIGVNGRLAVKTFDAVSGRPRGPDLRCENICSVTWVDGGHLIDVIQPDQQGVPLPGPMFLRVRAAATGNEMRRTPLDHPVGYEFQKEAEVSHDGRVICVTHADDKSFAYDTATGKKLRRLAADRDEGWSITPSGQVAVQVGHVEHATGKRPLRVFDLSTAEPDRPATRHLVHQLDWAAGISPDGRYVALGDSPGDIVDLRTSNTVRSMKSPVAFFPDGKSVLTLPGIRGAERVSLEPLAWKVAPPPKPSEARLKQLWSQLGEPAALDAVLELARHPAEAVPFLKAKLLAEPPDPKAVAGHIDLLGSRLFAEREESTKALRAFGPVVLPALRAALKAGPSPEARDRLAKLIAGHADTATPSTLARLRAVEALERCGTPAAVAVLEAVAKTAPGTPWGADAARAMGRVRTK